MIDVLDRYRDVVPPDGGTAPFAWQRAMFPYADEEPETCTPFGLLVSSLESSCFHMRSQSGY